MRAVHLLRAGTAAALMISISCPASAQPAVEPMIFFLAKALPTPADLAVANGSQPKECSKAPRSNGGFKNCSTP